MSRDHLLEHEKLALLNLEERLAELVRQDTLTKDLIPKYIEMHRNLYHKTMDEIRKIHSEFRSIVQQL